MKVGTGLSGFIGSHLAKKLDIEAIPHEKIDKPLPEFDSFFFLSSFGNLIDQIGDAKILKANISDLITVLNQIDWKNLKMKSFVYMSTSSVKLPIQTMYSRCKRASEEILLSFMEKYKAPISIIRPFSVTGVGEQANHLIPTLIRSCVLGEPIVFAPEPCHDFIDVEDVVNGIINLSEHHARGIFELGTGIQHTNQEVLELVEKIGGKKCNVIGRGETRKYDTSTWVSTNFAARSWGWLPKKTLEQSIKEQFEHFTERNH